MVSRPGPCATPPQCGRGCVADNTHLRLRFITLHNLNWFWAVSCGRRPLLEMLDTGEASSGRRLEAAVFSVGYSLSRQTLAVSPQSSVFLFVFSFPIPPFLVLLFLTNLGDGILDSRAPTFLNSRPVSAAFGNVVYSHYHFLW